VKNHGGNRQQAEAELVYINLERCNFFREKIEAIAKHYFFEMLIYFFWPYNGSNCEIKAMKCFLHNPHALTWGENELTRF
jgi:hypothetical protein